MVKRIKLTSKPIAIWAKGLSMVEDKIEKGSLVSIYNINGKRLFMKLVYTGDEVMPFESGHGFITKSQCRYNKWEIRKDC